MGFFFSLFNVLNILNFLNLFFAQKILKGVRERMKRIETKYLKAFICSRVFIINTLKWPIKSDLQNQKKSFNMEWKTEILYFFKFYYEITPPWICGICGSSHTSNINARLLLFNSILSPLLYCSRLTHKKKMKSNIELFV